MEVAFDVADAHSEALAGGALAYSRLHERLLRPSAEAVPSADFNAVLRRHSAQPITKGPSPQLGIDTAATMASMLANCAPRMPTPERLHAAASPSDRSGIALSRGRTRIGRPPTISNTGGGPTSVGPHLRELVGRLDAAEAHRRIRTNGATPRRSAVAAAVATASDAVSTTPLTSAPVRAWVRQRTSLYAGATAVDPTQRSAPESATNARDARPRPLLKELMAGRFPRDRAQTPHRGQWPSLSSESQQRDIPPASPAAFTLLLTEVPLEGSHPPDLTGSTPSVDNDPREEPAITDAALLERLSKEPVRSYRVLQDATMRPSSALLMRTSGSGAARVGSSALARENLARSRRLFEHSRYARQAELLTFLEWRGACRSAVTRDAVHAAADHDTSHATAAQQHRIPLAAAAERAAADGTGGSSFSTPGNVADDVLNAVRRSEELSKACPQRPAGSTRFFSRRRHSAPAAGALSSVWTRAAAVRAVEEMRKELCGRLAAFTLTFPAAALSRQSMEALQADVISQVQRTPAPRLFSRSDLRAFLMRRQSLRGTTVGSSRTAVVSFADLIDSMPSPAEAAFVRHAFDTLP